ncbi:hypothetical protein DACRYDRAFT_23445 [Dacryopinax primogenitus]|uniref:glycogenin glucosyltransferase n=1 Tax=Dacryopinax primogenitus (strain DJM 731) TaxID=1858805 RepID=M5G1W9_DACPD|nr:uncharacterized protein DACRYDRAFT_23445 [Dacryopinax primogenitus]EJT99896.1 hypothetical protein DACRYDRAFT_23445 [Dacryopinax primogenitus]
MTTPLAAPAADPPYAFVTLVSSDSYLPGALVVAHALRDVHPKPANAPEVDFQTVCLVTPEVVDVATIRALRQAFDLVVGVEVIDDQSQLGVENLGLLGRRDLTTVLTKLHVFRLTHFRKIIFLDADVLPLQPISHLFKLDFSQKLAAAPDAGWPDCFNSGVMVLQPSEASFGELRDLARTRGSWDGGDQGLLNEWVGNDWHRISFRYNTTPTAAYTYKPAYARFHEEIKLLHFIGSHKPWASLPIRPSRPPPRPLHESHDTAYGALVDQWYAVYDRHYRPLSNVDDFLPEDYQPGPGPEATTTTTTAPSFQPPHYAAAWDEPKPFEAQPEAGPVYGLEELRELAVKGVGSAYTVTDGEGRYESLPLEGRVDLLCPKFEEEEEKEDEDVTPKASDYQLPPPPVQMGEYPPHLQRPPAPPPPPLPPVHAPQPVQEYFPPQPAYQEHQQPGPSVHHEQAWHPEPTYHEPQWQPPPPPPPQQQEQGQPPPPPPQQQEQWQPPPPPHQDWQPPHEEHQPYVPPPQEREEYHPPQPEPAAPAPPPPPPEPFSAPIMTWNPAHEPPPNKRPSHAPVFPEWTGNVWEQPSYRDQREFFHAPPPTQIPQHLVDQGQYEKVMHHAPDPRKVNPIFPWEKEGRPRTQRVWPEGEYPLPEIKPLLPEVGGLEGPTLTVQSPSPTVPPGRTFQEHQPPPSPPTYGLPQDMTFRNAWDADPHIQRYVSKLSRPSTVGSRQPSFAVMRRSSPLSTPGIKGNFAFRRPAERGEGADASSRDGDDEEDEQESESENGAAGAAEEVAEEGKPGRKSPKSRSGSVSSRGGESFGPSKAYRSQAVQTEPPPKKKSRGIQVQIPRTDFFIQREPKKDEGVQTPEMVMLEPHPPLESTHMPVPDAQYLLPQHHMPATPSPYDEPMMPTHKDGARGRLADVETDETPVQVLMPPPLVTTDTASATESYFLSTVESPREVAANPPNLHPGLEPLSPPLRPGPTPIPAHMRISSNETQSSGIGGSPPSSILMSPRDGEEMTSPRTQAARLAIRRWDPARDVDLFKRDSQEVLARFLRMNDWEEAR